MLFNSIEFLFFFLAVTALYFLLPHRFRWLWLLAASCYFYMFFVPIYILILAGTIVIDYFAGIWIEGAAQKNKRVFLILSLIANIGVLMVFKYYPFLRENALGLGSSMGLQLPLPVLKILLPVGLSFHTFQAMSYTIEVYRGNQKAERHFGIYALYVMFYPQLVAGPIERPQNLLGQFRKKMTWDYGRIVSGLHLMMWGLFKKSAVADRLSILVDRVFNSPEPFDALSAALATLFFTIQIYCDFSGYSDMAIGAARVMGFDLMKNFSFPYFAGSVDQFWKKWHISLSTWFKDYLYIPLGGNRVAIPRWYANLFVVFLVSGFWHGANWTFVVWGALHGVFSVGGIMMDRNVHRWNWLKPLVKPSALRTTILVGLAWIFFRAENFQDAAVVFKHLFLGWGEWWKEGLASGLWIHPLLGTTREVLLALSLMTLLLLLEHLQQRWSLYQRWVTQAGWLRWFSYAVFVWVILAFGVFEHKQFIYFQF